MTSVGRPGALTPGGVSQCFASAPFAEFWPLVLPALSAVWKVTSAVLAEQLLRTDLRKEALPLADGLPCGTGMWGHGPACAPGHR